MNNPVEDFFGKADASDVPIYIKFPEGKTKLRVLSDKLIMGWEGWKDGKPVRVSPNDSLTEEEKNLLDKRKRDDGSEYPAYQQFGACLVYNYTLEAVQIWSFTQASIKNAFTQYTSDPDWGDLREFDLTIERTGKDKQTRYTVTPSPKKPLTEAQKKAFASTRLDPKTLLTDPSNLERLAEIRNAGDVQLSPDDIPF